jgi:hypothetical protein
MAPAQKQQCKNNAQYTYTGKEMSPLGLGFCADAESVGTQMVGRDNKNWIVGVKNNDKIWIRAPEKPVLVKEEPVLTSDAEEEEKQESEAVEEPKEQEKPKRKYTKKTKAVEPEAAKPEEEKSEGEAVEEPKVEEKPKRKYTKKAKADAKPEGEEKPEGAVEKPKRKYTKKTKAIVEGEEPVVEKKAHAKRGPSGYNLFIGKKISELRLEQTGLKTTEYMKMAQDIWREMSKEEQTEVSKVLKEEHVAANA